MSAFIFQTFSKVIILADYYINKDFISKVLCINRDKPQMHCEGKCHLQKQLEKEKKKEQSPLNSLKDKQEIQLFSEKKDGLTFIPAVITDRKDTPYQCSAFSEHFFSVFHPPKV